MMPGPTIIRKCSACGKLIAERTITSGNTFEARYWTDGKRDAPMLPDSPWLIKCPHCASLLWIDEQEQVDEIYPWIPCERERTNLNEARVPLTPTMKDYLVLLSVPVSDREKEKYLRMRAWQAGNDPRRESESASKMTNQETANLQKLLLLLDEPGEENRLLKGEILRELGMFSEALLILRSPFGENYMKAVDFIRLLAEQGFAAVKEMEFTGE